LGAIVQLMPTWFTLQFGASESTAGLWVALSNFAGIFAIPLIPRLVKQRGTVFTTFYTMVLSCVFLALMPLAGTLEQAGWLFVARSVLLTISWPILQSYMMGIVSERERATVTGITYTAWALLSSVGTFVGGALLGIGQLTWPFVIGVLGYLLTAILLLVFFRKIKPPEELELSPESSEIKSG